MPDQPQTTTPLILLHIKELGEYPDLTPIFSQFPLQSHQVNSMRKGLSSLKQLQPDIIIAEFNYQPTYGSQISNIESLLAKLQSTRTEARVILFYHGERAQYLEHLRTRFPVFAVMAYPVTPQKLHAVLQQAISAQANVFTSGE